MLKNTTNAPFLYHHSLALLTDLYQLTMAYGYWKQKMDRMEAVFHLTFRRPPFHGGFTVAAGLEAVVQFIENFRFEASDLTYLSGLKDSVGEALFPDSFLKFLGELKLECDVDAVPEGTLVFPQEPMIRVQGPLLHCQLLESPLLNLINFPTLIATKAARVVLSAKGDAVLEFGMRRAQGIDGAVTASRAAYVGGCDATSNVLAGKLFGIPVGGTHSHSWVMAFEDEKESFKAFAEVYPNNCVFLVDTYDSIEGVKHAIDVGLWLKERGSTLLGIRLDSGDLAYLSIRARKLLDNAGLTDAKIYASNELDETLVADLKRQGAQITVWGVGTNLVTGKEQPALDGVYKLSALRSEGSEKWEWKLKLSEQMIKVSNPGILQVRRFSDAEGNISDIIYDVETPLTNGWHCIDPSDPTRERFLSDTLEWHDLLVPVFRKGKRVYDLPLLQDIRNTTLHNLERFPAGVKRFINPHLYLVGMEKSLYDRKVEMIRQIRATAKEKKK